VDTLIVILTEPDLQLCFQILFIPELPTVQKALLQVFSPEYETILNDSKAQGMTHCNYRKGFEVPQEV